MKIKNILLKCFSVLMLTTVMFLTACATDTEKTLNQITKTSQSVYISAEEISDSQAPTYATQTSTQNNSNSLITTITQNSSEMIVKLGNIGTSLQTLSATITQFKTESKKLTDNNTELTNQDLETLKQIQKNLETIKNNISEKKTALQQDIATINTNIQNYIQNMQGTRLQDIVTAIEQCYNRVFNSIDFVITKVSEVNTLLTTAIETIQKYTQEQPEQEAV